MATHINAVASSIDPITQTRDMFSYLTDLKISVYSTTRDNEQRNPFASLPPQTETPQQCENRDKCETGVQRVLRTQVQHLRSDRREKARGGHYQRSEYVRP